MNHLVNIGCGLVVLALLRALVPDYLAGDRAWFWMLGWITCYVMSLFRA